MMLTKVNDTKGTCSAVDIEQTKWLRESPKVSRRVGVVFEAKCYNARYSYTLYFLHYYSAYCTDQIGYE